VTLTRALGDVTPKWMGVRLEEALLNSCQPIEASPRGAAIEVGIQEKDGRALVEVRDHGWGMPDTCSRVSGRRTSRRARWARGWVSR